MAAVLPYRCTCGESILVSIRGMEEAQEDVLRSAGWDRVMQTVAGGLGSRVVDRRDTSSFVCASCSAVHERRDGVLVSTGR